MMALIDIHNENERLSILHALNASKAFKGNDHIIRTTCEAFNNLMSSDQIKTHLYWLQEQGLVRLNVIETCVNATLTARGQDVSLGLAIVPGVLRPRAK